MTVNKITGITSLPSRPLIISSKPSGNFETYLKQRTNFTIILGHFLSNLLPS